MKALKAILIGLVTIVLAAAPFALSAWSVMLVVGALWHQFGWLQPVSFWQACLVTLALSVVGQFFRSAS